MGSWLPIWQSCSSLCSCQTGPLPGRQPLPLAAPLPHALRALLLRADPCWGLPLWRCKQMGAVQQVPPGWPLHAQLLTDRNIPERSQICWLKKRWLLPALQPEPKTQTPPENASAGGSWKQRRRQPHQRRAAVDTSFPQHSLGRSPVFCCWPEAPLAAPRAADRPGSSQAAASGALRHTAPLSRVSAPDAGRRAGPEHPRNTGCEVYKVRSSGQATVTEHPALLSGCNMAVTSMLPGAPPRPS